jgi:hypothetical protein
VWSKWVPMEARRPEHKQASVERGVLRGSGLKPLSNKAETSWMATLIWAAMTPGLLMPELGKYVKVNSGCASRYGLARWHDGRGRERVGSAKRGWLGVGGRAQGGARLVCGVRHGGAGGAGGGYEVIKDFISYLRELPRPIIKEYKRTGRATLSLSLGQRREWNPPSPIQNCGSTIQS